jgi:TDG/mug DNA glycosylase family protein
MTARRFTRAQLETFRGATVEDVVGNDVRLLFVGINPGLWTAAANAHFARPGNRFWPALHRAGVLPRLVEASDGMAEEDRDLVTGLGIAITNLVARATARASEVSRDELAAGADRLRVLVEGLRPRVVAILGVTAYRQAFDDPQARTGRQSVDLRGAELWVLPNPSGLNAHETIESLAAAYAEAARAADLPHLEHDET